MTKKVAVIGSGISGISSAWFLSQAHEVTLFEKNDYLGGHTHTVDLDFTPSFTPGIPKIQPTTVELKQPVDTGFIVYNEPNYPYLTAMLKHLGVATQNTDMSFGVSIDQGKLEYAGSNLNTLFAQRKNLLRPSHWSMIFEIMRFNKQAKSDLEQAMNDQQTLGDYLDQHQFSKDLQHLYLLPMAAAIWSCPVDTMRQFPVKSFLRFFHNHGLLNVNDRPQWQTVIGGAREYLNAILSLESFKVIQAGISQVKCVENGVLLADIHGNWHQFDEVVFACHADQTRRLLPDDDFELLDAFEYQANDTWLHSDESLMPKSKLSWSAWNYLSETHGDQTQVSVTYWMNLLQNFETPKPILVSLNPPRPPKSDTVWQRMTYDHPVFNQAAMAAQKELPSLQGKKHCWFTGSYFGYGFHEDGLKSAVDLAKTWGLPLPWEKEATRFFQKAQSELIQTLPASDKVSHYG